MMKTRNNKSKNYNRARQDNLRIKFKRRKKGKQRKKRKPDYGFQGPPQPDNRLLSDEEIKEIIDRL